MKIGVIFAIHCNSESEIESVLKPWIELESNYNHQIVKTAVSYTFAENRNIFSKEENAQTIKYLKNSNHFSFIFSDEDDETGEFEEAKVRDKALQYLKTQNVDVICIWDGDEFATAEQLKNIFSFVEKYDEFCWYSISYKNYVFDENTFLTDPFTPPRIFRTRFYNASIGRFYLDNDISYEAEGQEFRFQGFPHRIIPKEIAWVKHLSWLSNERSRRKVAYQKAHFAKYGGECSYAWDEKENKLIFDLDFFKKRGLMIPKIEYEKS